MSQDRRQYRRIPIGASVNFQELSFQKDSETLRTSYRDVSVGGLLVHSETEVPLGTLLKLECRVPGWGKHIHAFAAPGEAELKPLVAVGQVVRLEKLEEGQGFELGVKFLNVYPDDLSALMKFIEASATEPEAHNP